MYEWNVQSDDMTCLLSALDLLQRMLTFDPVERISMEQALSHPYLAEFACRHDEPVAMQPLCIELEVCTTIWHAHQYGKYVGLSSYLLS